MIQIISWLPHTILIALLLCGIFSLSALAASESGKKKIFTSNQSSTVFVFSPKHLSWAAYYNGKKIRSGKASGGKAYCPDIGRGCKTIVGTFRIISKKGPGCKSSKFPVETRGGALMPWCMHFHHKGYAIHGSPDVPNYNASHGCIRVKPKDAKWLNQEFLRIGSKVVVLSY